MSGKVLVTPRSLSAAGHPALARLVKAGYTLAMPAPGQTPSEAQLMSVIPDCVGWLAGVETVTPAVIAAAENLRVISRNGTGVDNLPMALLEAKGIKVCRAAGTNARGVAELALTLTLAGLRDVVPTHVGMQTGQWPRRIGSEIKDAEVAVIGLGAIGGAFARFCLGLGAKVRGYDPFSNGGITDPDFRHLPLDEALRGAAVVSLHAPMPSDGSALLGAGALAELQSGAIVVNTARAGLVDDDAMLAALESGQVGIYATDVFHTEPPEMTALLRHPRVITTTHIGGFTNQSVERSTICAVDNLLQALGHDAV